MSATPLLSDVQFTNFKYEAGDRILARVHRNLTSEQTKNVCISVRKATREDVRVLVINSTENRIQWTHKETGLSSLLVGIDDSIHRVVDPSVMDLDCSVVDLKAGDKLEVFMPFWTFTVPGVRYTAHKVVQEWAGQDVEVVVMARGN